MLFRSMKKRDLFHHRIHELMKNYFKEDEVMNLPSSAPIPAQGSDQDPRIDSQYAAALQTSTELVRLQKRLGLNLTIHDKDLNQISGTFDDVDQLLKNADFLSRLSQIMYVRSSSGSWFKLSICNGKLKSIRFLLIMIIKWI